MAYVSLWIPLIRDVKVYLLYVCIYITAIPAIQHQTIIYIVSIFVEIYSY